MPRLQMGVETTKPIKTRLTPLDKEVPPHVAEAAAIVIAFLDGVDVKPGDGIAELGIDRKVNWGFIHTEVKGDVFMQLKP